MPATMPQMDLKRLNEILMSESGRAHFESHYPDLMSWYDEHIGLGLQSSIVQASLKAMWQQEMERHAESFCESLETGAAA